MWSVHRDDARAFSARETGISQKGMLTLYFAPGSSSMAPHIALHEVGGVFESRPISFARLDQRESSFLALNPEGKVPMLLVDGRPLTEVGAIAFLR